MTKLVSGRVLKTPSANVSADRYQFLEISEAEPDLGVPPANTYIFTSDPEGNRQWADLTTVLGNSDVSIGNVYVAGTLFGNNLIVRNIDILDAIIGITTLANNIVTVTVLADSITANTWNNLYTANVVESPDYLYYSNDRVFSNILLASIGDLADVTTANIETGQALVWNGNIFIPVFVNSEVANVADLAIRVLSIENFTTANVAEASSNLYFTNSRVLDALVGSDIAVNNLLISGDLTVDGNTTTLNVATLIIEDKNITVANGAPSAAAADGAGITIEGANATILYRESGDKFELNKNLDVTGNITGNLIGNVTGDVTGEVTGNVVGTVSDISNHTTDDLAEGGNLYYTDARVLANVGAMSVNVLSDVDITGILPGQIIAWDGAKFVPGSADVALFSEQSNSAVVANTVLSLEGLTTDDLNEGNVSLYFSNTRARQAFSAGRGIVIQENGVIKSTDDSDLYNLAINGSIPYIVTDAMATAVTFPTVPAEDRFILRSIHVTNISETDAFISGNILYASGNTAFIADMMPLPLGGTLEFLKKTQVMQPGDKINFQSFDNAGTPANNTVSAIFTYETLAGEQDFFGAGLELNAGNVDTLVFAADQSYTILESIKLVNLEDYVIRAKVFWADANDVPRAYFSYNLPLPPNSSVELLQAPKRIEFTDKIYVNYIANSELSVFVSGRIGSLFTLSSFTGNVESGSNVEASFSTTEDEGTVLYYSIE